MSEGIQAIQSFGNVKESSGQSYNQSGNLLEKLKQTPIFVFAAQHPNVSAGATQT